MKRSFWISVFAFFMLLSGAVVTAISANDAVGYVVRDGHYLLTGETHQVPISPTTYDSKKYWVIPVVSGEDIITYFPVKNEKAELQTHRPTNRELFKTADILREFNVEKEKISKSQTTDWFFTNFYVLVFNELSTDFSNEIFELNIIDTTLNDKEVSAQISKIKPLATAISQKSNDISQKINAAAMAESDFFSAPTPEKADSLQNSFNDVFDSILELNSLALDYRDRVTPLKQAISVLDADAAAKEHTIKLSSPPTSFNNIGKYATSSIELSQGIKAIYSNVSSRSDALLNEFESRIKRNDAFDVLYGENEKLKSATNSEIVQIQKGVETILSEDNRPYWKNQELIKTLDSKWSQAQRAFNSRDYDSSILLAGKVIDDIVAIYNQGFTETQPKPIISQDLLFQLIVGLVVLLALLFIYSRRDKIINFGKETEQEVEINAWKER